MRPLRRRLPADRARPRGALGGGDLGGRARRVLTTESAFGDPGSDPGGDFGFPTSRLDSHGIANPELSRVILLPVYAILIWFVIAFFRRRWQAFVILALSGFPVLLLTHLCIQYIPLPSGEPKPSWLYGISGAYAMLILVIGFVIAVQHHTRTVHDCHACGYDLTGTTSRVCPECGERVRCRKCHRALGGMDRRCPVCRTPTLEFAPRPARTALPEVRREEASVLARRFATRLRSIASESGHAQRDHEAERDQAERAADLSGVR